MTRWPGRVRPGGPELMGWELLTRRTGGTVAGLAAASTTAGRTLLFAATPTGLYRSADAGRSWTATGAGGGPLFLEALAVAPRFERDRTVFVGNRDGVHRSTDGGATWELALDGGRVQALAAALDEAGAVVLLAGTDQDGVLRSADAGQTWSGANPGLLDLDVLALALSPRFAEDRTGFAATATGLYRSRNGGRAWRAVELPVPDPAVQCLAVSPDFGRDRLVLAGTEAHGLLHSQDGGATWELAPALEGQGITALAFATRYPERPLIAAAAGETVYLSRDGGASWTPVAAPPGPVLCLAFAIDGDGEALLAGCARQGAWRLSTDARVWLDANDGLAGHLLTGLAALAEPDGRSALVLASLEEGVLVTRDGGQSWTAARAGLEDALVYGLGPSPDYPRDRTLFATTSAGLLRSQDGGATWHPVGSWRGPLAPLPPAVGARSSGGLPVAVATQDGMVHVSADGGARWRALDAPTGGALVALALDGGAEPGLFAATREASGPEGRLALWWSSLSAGPAWSRLLAGPDAPAAPLLLLPGAGGDRTLLVGLGGQVCRARLGPPSDRAARPPVWQRATLGNGATPALALAAAPDGSTVFAATGAGLFVSRDGGATFDRWSAGPAAPPVGLAVAPTFPDDRSVYLADLGGAVWRWRDKTAAGDAPASA